MAVKVHRQIDVPFVQRCNTIIEDPLLAQRTQRAAYLLFKDLKELLDEWEPQVSMASRVECDNEAKTALGQLVQTVYSNSKALSQSQELLWLELLLKLVSKKETNPAAKKKQDLKASALLETLLKQKIISSLPDDYLVSAYENGCVEFLRLALEKVCTEDQLKKYVKTKEQQTQMHLACLYGLQEIALLLVERGVDVSLPDIEGNTPLHHAAEHQAFDMNILLRTDGALRGLCHQNLKREKPFQRAVRSGNQQGVRATFTVISKLLSGRGDSPYHKVQKLEFKWEYRDCLREELWQGHFEMLQCLLQLKTNIRLDLPLDHRLFFRDAFESNIDDKTLALLLEKFDLEFEVLAQIPTAKFSLVDPSWVKITSATLEPLIYLAIRHGHLTLLKILVENADSPTFERIFDRSKVQRHFFHDPVSKLSSSWWGVFCYLYKAEQDPYFLAIHYNHLHILEFLFGLDWSRKKSLFQYCISQMHITYAVLVQAYPIAFFLILKSGPGTLSRTMSDEGGYLELKDKDHYVPLLEYACSSGEKAPANDKRSVVATLVIAGVDLRLPYRGKSSGAQDGEEQGRSAIHEAADSSNFLALHWLLFYFKCSPNRSDKYTEKAFKSAINARTSWGRTPLHLALDTKSIPCSFALIKYGAEADEEAVKLAEKNKLWPILRFLWSEGKLNLKVLSDPSPIFSQACQLGEIKAREFLVSLLEEGHFPDRLKQTTVLNTVCQYGFEKLAIILMKLGCSTNLQDRSGRLPVHWAVTHTQQWQPSTFHQLRAQTDNPFVPDHENQSYSDVEKQDKLQEVEHFINLLYNIEWNWVWNDLLQCYLRELFFLCDSLDEHIFLFKGVGFDVKAVDLFGGKKGFTFTSEGYQFAKRKMATFIIEKFGNPALASYTTVTIPEGGGGMGSGIHHRPLKAAPRELKLVSSDERLSDQQTKAIYQEISKGRHELARVGFSLGLFSPPNSTDLDSITLFWCSPGFLGHLDLYEECGFDLTLRDLQDETLLHHAGRNPRDPGIVRAIQKLLELQVNLSLRNLLGKTALEIAKENNSDEEVVRLLTPPSEETPSIPVESVDSVPSLDLGAIFDEFLEEMPYEGAERFNLGDLSVLGIRNVLQLFLRDHVDFREGSEGEVTTLKSETTSQESSADKSESSDQNDELLDLKPSTQASPTSSSIRQGQDRIFKFKGEFYSRQRTQGRGACALHALLGNSTEGGYLHYVDPEGHDHDLAVKELFLARLQEVLEVEEGVRLLFINALIQIMSPKNPSAEYQMIFESVEVQPQYQAFVDENQRLLGQIEKHKEIEAGLWYKFLQIKEMQDEDITNILSTSSPSIQQLLNLYGFINPPEKRKVFLSLLNDLERKAIEEVHHRLQKYEAVHDQNRARFLVSDVVKNKYFQCFTEGDYYLNQEELKIAAHLFKKSIRIFSFVTSENAYYETDVETSPIFEGEVLISCQGAHYERVIKVRAPSLTSERQSVTATTSMTTPAGTTASVPPLEVLPEEVSSRKESKVTSFPEEKTARGAPVVEQPKTATRGSFSSEAALIRSLEAKNGAMLQNFANNLDRPCVLSLVGHSSVAILLPPTYFVGKRRVERGGTGVFFIDSLKNLEGADSISVKTLQQRREGYRLAYDALMFVLTGSRSAVDSGGIDSQVRHFYQRSHAYYQQTLHPYLALFKKTPEMKDQFATIETHIDEYAKSSANPGVVLAAYQHRFSDDKSWIDQLVERLSQHLKDKKLCKTSKWSSFLHLACYADLHDRRFRDTKMRKQTQDTLLSPVLTLKQIVAQAALWKEVDRLLAGFQNGSKGEYDQILEALKEPVRKFCDAVYQPKPPVNESQQPVLRSRRLSFPLDRREKHEVEQVKRVEKLERRVERVEHDQKEGVEFLLNRLLECKDQGDQNAQAVKVIEATLREKAELEKAQETFLLGQPEQVQVYCQTFQTELASALLSLLMLQNRAKIFTPTHGQLNAFAVKQEQSSLGDQVAAGARGMEPVLEVLEYAKEHLESLKSLPDAFEFLSLSKIASFAKGVVESVASFCEYAPIISFFAKGMKFAIKKWNEHIEKAEIQNVRKAYLGLTLKQIDEIANKIARELSLEYKDAICLLDRESAIRFAQYGVVRIVVSLLNGHVTNPAEFVSQACHALRTLKVKQDEITILEYRLPFTSEPLMTHGSSHKLYEDDLYRKLIDLSTLAKKSESKS